LKKRHDLGHLSFSLNRANKINMSKLDKRLPNNAIKFGDHLSIISLGNDVQKFLFIFGYSGPLKRLIKLSSVEIDV
jgi:hypothetical protein